MIYSFFDIKKTKKSYAQIYSALPDTEKKYTDRIKNTADRARHIYAYALLSTLYHDGLARTGEISFADVAVYDIPCLKRGKNGKPYFSCEGLWFSISHCENIVMAAIADVPIGADVQIVRKSRRNNAIIERFFSLREADEDFFAVWTKKEAAVKIDGGGISKMTDTDTASGEFSFVTGEKCDGDGQQYRYAVAVKNASPASDGNI